MVSALILLSAKTVTPTVLLCLPTPHIIRSIWFALACLESVRGKFNTILRLKGGGAIFTFKASPHESHGSHKPHIDMHIGKNITDLFSQWQKSGNEAAVNCWLLKNRELSWLSNFPNRMCSFLNWTLKIYRKTFNMHLIQLHVLYSKWLWLSCMSIRKKQFFFPCHSYGRKLLFGRKHTITLLYYNIII